MFYVYQILNKKNGKKYIGQTDDKDKRKYKHFFELKNGTHDNSYLQRSYDKYGKESFVFSVIDTTATNRKELTDLEEYYILQAGFPDKNKCYNLKLPNGIPAHSYKIYQEKQEDICNDYKNGMTVRQIYKKYNIGKTLFYKILRNNNIVIGEKKRINLERRGIYEQKICDYYKQGLSSHAIAKKYNCTSRTILKIVRRNGLYPHKNIIDRRGGVDYLYKHKDNDIHKDIIRAYLSKKGVGAREFFDLSFAQTSLIDYPDEVCLCLNTKGCENNCIYCFNKRLTKGKPLSFDVAKLAIDANIQYITSISLTGGEPLLNDDLSQIIDYAHDNNLKTKIDTSLNGDINNISSNIDLINISIKNYSHLLSILDNINYLIENHYCCEFNLVYHSEYIDKEECKKINNVISSYNIPLILVEMDVSYCDFDESPSRDELIELSSLFDVEDIYIQTKEYGREKI